MAPDSIQQRAARIIQEFDGLADAIEQYRHIVALGDDMPRIADEDKTDENYLPGCQYDIWIQAEYDTDRDVIRFRADSDARITRGLAALIIRVVDGQPPTAVAAAEFGFLDTIGVRGHLSAQRSNGLTAMIDRMKGAARKWEANGAGGAGQT